MSKKNFVVINYQIKIARSKEKTIYLMKCLTEKEGEVLKTNYYGMPQMFRLTNVGNFVENFWPRTSEQ